MSGRSLIPLAILLTAAVPTAGLCQGPDQLKLSLRDGVGMVLENNYNIRIEKIFPRISEAEVARARGEFDHEAFGSFKREDSTTPLSARSRASAGGITSLKSETNTLDAGLEGKTTFGTKYSFEIKDEWTANTLNGFKDEYISFTGVTITQPLLKDFGTETNTTKIRIAGKDRDISVHRLKSEVITNVSEFSLVYWDLVRAREELSAAEESLGLAEALLDINRKKLEAGSASVLDVIQAESAAATRKDAVLVARRTLKERETTLKGLIAEDAVAIRDREIVPTGTDGISSAVEGMEESVDSALKRRPDYLELKSAIEKSSIQLKFASNQKFPSVDLEASYGYNGLGSSLNDSFSGIEDNPQWSLGLLFRYPLENRVALGDLRIARYQAQQAALRLKRLEQNIILNLDRSIEDISTEQKRTVEAKNATRLARESLSAEEKKLAAGRSTTYNVLQIQEDLAKARLNEISALADYNKALIRYHREKGTLLEEFGVEFKEESAVR